MHEIDRKARGGDTLESPILPEALSANALSYHHRLGSTVLNFFQSCAPTATANNTTNSIAKNTSGAIRCYTAKAGFTSAVTPRRVFANAHKIIVIPGVPRAVCADQLPRNIVIIIDVLCRILAIGERGNAIGGIIGPAIARKRCAALEVR
jgi:hypothetical protein